MRKTVVNGKHIKEAGAMLQDERNSHGENQW